jgi:hypothetical protein
MERFITTITLVATIAVLVTVLVTTVAALSLPLAAIMPDFALRGTTFTFRAFNMGLFFIPLLMIPIGFALRLVFFRKPIFMMLSIMLLFGLYWGGILGSEGIGRMMNPLYIVALLVLSWVIFVALLHHICMRRCLVGQ